MSAADQKDRYVYPAIFDYAVDGISVEFPDPSWAPDLWRYAGRSAHKIRAADNQAVALIDA